MTVENISDFKRRFYTHRQSLSETGNSSKNIEVFLPDEFKVLKKILRDEEYYALWGFQVVQEGYHEVESYSQLIKNLVFINCRFDTGLIFRDFKILKRFIFINCTFKSLYLPNPSASLFFINCEFLEDLRINGDNQIEGKEILFKESTFRENLEIDNLLGIKSLKLLGRKGRKIFGDMKITKIKSELLDFERLEVSGQVIIDGSTQNGSRFVNKVLNLKRCNWASTSFMNIGFTDSSTIHGLSSENIDFQNCEFSQLIISSNLKTNSYVLWNSKVEKIMFNDLNLIGSILIEDRTSIEELGFHCVKHSGDLTCVPGGRIDTISLIGTSDICSEFERISLSGTLNKIIISDGLVKEKLHLNGIKNLISISINSSKINELNWSFVSNKEIEEISFCHNTVSLKCSVNGGSFNSFLFTDNIFEDDLDFSNCVFSKNLELGSSFFNKLQFLNTNLKYLKVESSFIGSYEINKSCELESKSLTFSSSALGYFKPVALDGVSEYYSQCIFSEANFERSSLGKDSAIVFSDSLIDQIFFKHYNVYGSLFFRNVKSIPDIAENEILKNLEQITGKNLSSFLDKTDSPKIELFYSSIGKTDFVEFDFSSYRIQFINSKLIDSFISGSSFPDKIEIPTSDDKEKFNQKVLVYNQLKKIAERNGDIVKSSLMHSKALANQKKVLSYETGKLSDKFVFWLNEVSNDHGESWFRALLFTLGGSVYLFLLYVLANSWQTNSSSFFTTSFLDFINPFSKLEFRNGALANFIHFIEKIFFSFGVFQLVTAFRRHGKK